MSKLTKKFIAMLLSGILVIGSATSSVLAESIDLDPSQTSEISEEVYDEDTSEAPTGEGEMAESEDASEARVDAGESNSEDALAEESLQYFTVTLDANGGYFVNEMNDYLGEIVEQAEVVVKQIPVDETVKTFPVFTDLDGQAMLFAGWSLEKDGELVSTGDEEYVPVESCTLYAVWQIAEESFGEAEGQGIADEGINQIETSQECGKVQATEELEDGNFEKDIAPEASSDSKLDNEPANVPEQEAVYIDQDAENTGEESSDAVVAKEETQIALIEPPEEEEIVQEDTSFSVVATGTCGDDLTWTLDEEGTLTINGTGNMINFDVNDNRWESFTVNEVVIENGVTSIGTRAFYKCSSLTSVIIPDSVISIGYEAFCGCSNLENVTIPETVTSIGAYAFCGCSSLINVTIPDGVTGIGSWVFADCSNLTNITLPDSITSIGNYAFFRCSSLTSVTIPVGVKRIRGYAFFECSSLTSVMIPEGVTSIDSSTFSGCSNLVSVTIPNSVTSIGQTAFSGCSGLTSVIIPESVKSIEYGAFSGCRSLTSVTIPKKVSSIITYTFSGCSSLTSVTIPDSVTSIGIGAFDGCRSLTSVTIPESVDSIGYSAFSGCSNLVSVTIPNSVTSIGQSAFSGCSGLTSVTIPESVTSIGDRAFANCASLNNIIVEPSNSEYSSKDGVLFDKEFVTLITYPAGKENSYSIPEGVKIIANSAFAFSSKLTNVVIPPGVSSIGDYSFERCSNLNSVTIPDGVNNIGDSAFYGCDILADVHFGGTRDSWALISIEPGNECLYGASLHFPPLNVSPVGQQIREVYPGQEITLEVNATSGSHIYYQWFEDEYDCEIDGETSNSCIISTYDDADFSCHVSDDDGNEIICTFSLKVVTVENNLKAYASKWGEDAKVVAVFVNPHGTVELKVTATADEMDGLTYTWYDQDNKLIQGATEATYQTGQLIRTGIISCEVKDKYYNVELVYFSIYIDNNLIAYSDSDDNHKDYSDIYVSPGDDLNLHVVVEASSMDDIQYQWFDDQGKEIPGATDTYYSVNNIKDFTYLFFRTIDRYGNKKYVYFFIWVRNLISNAEIVFTESTHTYTGKAIMPIAFLFYDEEELFEGDDYTISYKNNINAGLATATITGKGKYTGTKTATFKINKAVQSITASNLSLTFPNSGKISVSGNKGKLSYKSDNTAIVTVDSTGKVIAKGVGTAKITISAAATDNYNAATKTITVTVAKAAQSITAKVAASSVAVDKTTTVSITGAKGTKSYKSSDTTIATVTSAGKVTAKKVGTVKITATSAATSNYKAASKAVTIKVVPAATSSLTADNQATGIKLTWKKVAGANAYFIYRGSTQIAAIKNGSTVTYTDKKANTNGTKYTYKIIASASATGRSTLSKSVTTYFVARPAISTLTNSAASKMTVKWCKNAKATGYQIQYCPDKTFKTGNKSVNVTSVSTVSKAIGSLAKGKTYYVRIRTYKTAGSTKYFSAWSAVKSVKISK